MRATTHSRAPVACRVTAAGAQLRMLVLAADAGGCLGVDLESGAFVRATYAGEPRPLSAFDVVRGRIADPAEPPDLSRPETVALDRPPRRAGRLTPRRAERWLQPLLHPPRRPLLDTTAPAVPYWTIAGDRPSLTLVETVVGPRVQRCPTGYECRFGWHGAPVQLPLVERRLVTRLDEVGWPRYSRRDLEDVLGHRVRRLLVVLSPPRNGYCYKVVAALLPGG